ncbi:hypothetical protein QKW60_02405 [Defluviimonas aestuarii]|uniref:hypothetical protein n=1 Tax=Albidovulum aestuarii TaxID=1130726 RepID=UPI00249C4AD1|nr:hypothetical protein [Defluviimonas aestuarii]MDI3335245.1 hypothetical protein [Defluviimonas aestuarii]
MVGASKILTVSYGTFSCTLEGFDDPFTTMKAIAEYFRELAADDRFFGAEPPTPDANMLHRIAEREIQRRVEAKVSDKGVVLRAERAPDTTAAQAEPTASTRRPAMDLAAVLAARARSVAPAAAPSSTTDTDADSIAAKLNRIRAVVNTEHDVTDAAGSAFEDDDQTGDLAVADPEPAGDFDFEIDLGDAVALDAAAAIDETVAETDPIGGDQTEDEGYAAEVAADTAEIDAPEAPPVTAGAEAMEALDESIDSEIDDQADVALTAGETAEADVALEMEARIADIEDSPAAGALEAVQAEDAVAEGVTAEDDGIAEEQAGEATASTDGVLDLGAWRMDDDAPDMTGATPEAAPADETPAPKGRVFKIERADTAPIAEAAEDTAQADEAASAEDQSRTAIFAALAEDIGVDEEEQTNEPQNEELEATEDNDDALLAGIGAAIGSSGLEPDAEDALLRELAAVAREARRDAHEGRAILESTSRDDGASVERLMEEAKSKLEGDENRRRFSAISHLKAAVAATVADRQMKSQGAQAELPHDDRTDLDRYRDDLSKAVRPRRSETEQAPAAEQAPASEQAAPEARPAPLVLVSEQRIDTPQSDNTSGAVRPSRVDTAKFMRDEESDLDDIFVPVAETPVSPGDAKNFAEFAERLGATSLPELLEAAAAYTATVEGQPHFSRPQILRKVAHVSEDADFSREDGLRSFGMLLREGKIQKISRGQFMITEGSKFLSEDRTASR